MTATSVFEGILFNAAMFTIRGRDANAANRRWIPEIQLNLALKQAAVDAGFFAHLPASVKTFGIELRYTDAYRLVPESTGLGHLGRKKHYNICVEANGVGLCNGPSDAERYWPLKRICLAGFAQAAASLKMPLSVIAALEGLVDALPAASPWPLLPAFDEALAPRLQDPVDGSAPVKPKAPKRDKDGRIRLVLPLDAEEGEVWVMTRIPTLFATDATDTLFESLKQFLDDEALGEWDGDSSGGHAADISFHTSNMRKAGKAIAAFLRERHPDVEFVISGDYETVFDDAAVQNP